MRGSSILSRDITKQVIKFGISKLFIIVHGSWVFSDPFTCKQKSCYFIAKPVNLHNHHSSHTNDRQNPGPFEEEDTLPALQYFVIIM